MDRDLQKLIEFEKDLDKLNMVPSPRRNSNQPVKPDEQKLSLEEIIVKNAAVGT